MYRQIEVKKVKLLSLLSEMVTSQGQLLTASFFSVRN